MTFDVGRREVREPGKRPHIVRAVLVGCDFPLCEKALEVIVNLQSSDYQCKWNTKRYIENEAPMGWKTDGKLAYCAHHAELKGMK